MREEAFEIALAELLDMFCRAIRQQWHGAEPRAWRPDEVTVG